MKSRRGSTLALGATVLMLARGWEALAPEAASLSRLDPLRISMDVVAADFGGAPPPLPQGHGHKMFDKGGPPPPPPPPPGGKGGDGKGGKGGKGDKDDKHNDKHKPPPKPKPPKPEPPPPTTTTTTTVTTSTSTTTST
jgi:hypothetical protein